MAGISFGGISSGLDTEAIVNQLISVESNPQVLLQQKLAKQNAAVTALQGINTRLASLATSAGALAKPTAWTTPTATSSSTSVTTATTAGAGAGSLTFNVTALARKTTYQSGVITDGATPGSRTVTLTPAGGTAVTLTAANGDAASFAAAINAANLGVDATTVRTGTDPAGKAQYRLLVTAREGGAKNDFTMTGQVPTATKTVTAADARITLAGGAVVTSPTNTFTDLLSGVNVTVSKVENDVTVTSAPDPAAVSKQAAGVVGALNVVLSEIAAQTKPDVSDKARGVLAGSSLLRGVQQQLADAVSTAVPGASLADLGIQLTRSGTVTLDEKAFAAYAQKEPAKAKAMTAAFAGALATTAKAASDAGTGSISQAVTAGQGVAKDLDVRIDAWDTRLELRRATLERQFAALEVALDRSKSTSNYLAGALAGLPS